MRELVAQIPDVDAFLALAPEELVAKILAGSSGSACAG
jgi:hypothetical protein